MYTDGIARRLIVALIVFSSVITTLLTAIELFLDYRGDIHGIENRLNFIETSYLPTIVEGVGGLMEYKSRPSWRDCQGYKTLNISRYVLTV